MILDFSRALYDSKIVGNAMAVRLYMRGKRSWCLYGVRWEGSESAGLKLRQITGL